jgi:hypothetical protein
MALTTATITTTTDQFPQVLEDLAYRIREHSPGALRAGTFTIISDTAGTIAFSYTDANGTFSKSLAAAVA